MVSNAGPSTVNDAERHGQLREPIFSCTFTSVAAGSASGNTASGSGNIADTLVLPADSSVTYTALCNISRVQRVRCRTLPA